LTFAPKWEQQEREREKKMITRIENKHVIGNKLSACVPDE
jgi:hypothetical protein